MERFWEEYSKFEGKQVIRQEMTAEEKKMAIVNAISHYADVYRNAVEVYVIIIIIIIDNNHSISQLD